MAQEPAVIVIARHGARLDAADQNWHLSTPTPYDPPLTYGGWNQCRALGVRIASLLHAREQASNELTTEPPPPEGVRSHDFAGQDAVATGHGDGSRKRKRLRHKVVVHSSPFLRCLQTSVAISAGMAQYQPGVSGSSTSLKSRSPSSMHSASPRLRAMDGLGPPSPGLTPIAEPKQDLAHVIARKALGEQQRHHRRTKMRVDAFLGEWLNPQYFDQITPPPPSAMMVATAKGELMQNEAVDVYKPAISSKSSNSSLWGGGGDVRSVSGGSSLDDWQHVQDTLAAPTPRRDRSSSVNSVSSTDSASGRKSPFRPGHFLQPNISTTPRSELSVYAPPTPHYAVSGSDQIPRGYVAHARSATVNVDYQWDSSRSPQNWGDGGEYGEEWSSMHKRFRRGLDHLVDWYGHHSVDDRAEDALGFDQADRHTEEDSDEQEDLVVVLVTHGAGCNALIGALTGQPVLLDVGMASLTMAVRKEDAPSSSSRSVSGNGNQTLPNGSTSAQIHRRTPSQGVALPALYEMKIVASTEHLRPGSDPSKSSALAFSPLARSPSAKQDSRYRFPQRSDSASAAASSQVMAPWTLAARSQSASLGSMRRPSRKDSTGARSTSTATGGLQRRSTEPRNGIDYDSPTTTPATSAPVTPPPLTGLWTPPGAAAKEIGARKEERRSFFSPIDQNPSDDGREPGDDLVLDFSNSPPETRPGTANGNHTKLNGGENVPMALDGAVDSPLTDFPLKPSVLANEQPSPKTKTESSTRSTGDGNGAPLSAIVSQESEQDALPELPAPGEKVPAALVRGLSQKGLWGSRPQGDEIMRAKGVGPKRRWTLLQE